MKRRPDLIDVSHAATIAARFLERGGCNCENPVPPCPQLTGEHFEYLTGEDSVIFEFPLKKKRAKSGYILISGSRDLPPVLEFCPTGRSLRGNLINGLLGLTRLRRLNSKSVAWRYFGPLDFVAELRLERGGYYYARLPNLRVVETRRRIQALDHFHRGQDQWIEARWKYYEAERASRGALSCGKMFGIRPFKYNQTCESSLHLGKSSDSNGSNYCTPSCIVGCVPTAWAVLASAWKSSAIGVSHRLFGDAPDWDRDWPSAVGGPPRPVSKVVNREMCKLRTYVGTSCTGETPDRSTILGSLIFDDYAVKWKWGSRKGVDYAFASSVNKAPVRQPGLLTAKSVWNPSAPPDGHAFVTHGFNDNEEHLYICLG